MRFRSRKTERAYVERRRLVAALLRDQPVCARCWAAVATEVHERRSRARGGDILDPANCVGLCHDCHAWVTVNPQAATETGWLLHSWDRP